MKKTIGKILLLCALASSLLVLLSSCRKERIDYIYLHDKSEIVSIEIIESFYDPNLDREDMEKTLVVIEDVEAFLLEFEEVPYYKGCAAVVGLEMKGISVKFIYANGDYELFRTAGRSTYTKEGYFGYQARGRSFDSEKLLALVSKYLGYEIDRMTYPDSQQ